MTRHRVNCVTCGRADYADGSTPPAGWGLECKSCKEGSPVRPKKAIRHCSYCRADIVVMSVPGGVRLVCSKCAVGDKNLVDTEKVQRDNHTLMAKLSDAEEQLATARTNLHTMEQAQEAELRTKLKIAKDELRESAEAVEAENLNLKRELQKKAEQTLADRIKAKMEAKPWQTRRETVREFLEWLKLSSVRYVDMDIEEILDRYINVNG